MAEPNKSEQEIVAEAAEAWRRMVLGDPYREIAADLGISVATLYRRLERLRASEGGLPSASRRAFISEQLETLYRESMTRVPSASNGDAARLIGEARQTRATLMSLHGLTRVPEEPPPNIYEDSGEWVDGDDPALLAALAARNEAYRAADAELAAVIEAGLTTLGIDEPDLEDQ